ncbi:HAMP domain-containing histidine kinase [Rhizobium sp. XQZ8]|uniref:sensor histidine kinase n=1 Tax=Rhizobium populisoli TaxID=2859785 RepID=UPI001C67AF0C|nr:ATP-binding protein [Rhizobium populisoli]MBW6421492.1 HAMP domain-containing histidine kinase [Rhizobium populisoli]
MHRGSLFRSTPFRLALTFGFLFVAAFAISGVVTYQLLARELAGALDASVSEIYSVTSTAYGVDDVEDLVSTINAYTGLSNSEDRVFSLVDRDGKRLAGNFTPPALPDGLSTVTAPQIGLSGDTIYRVNNGTIGGYRLVVGQSFTETDDLQEIALVSFGWALVITIAVAIAGGAFLASRAQRRMDGIARTMIDVSNGQLATRIPLHGRKDDIDEVSMQINQALDRLSGLVEGMRQVSADIAHELKTPLNRLRLTIEEAASRSEDRPELHSLMTDALAESDQLNATFEALLRISQIEAGSRRTRFQPIDLAAIMATVADIYGSVAEDNAQTLRLEALPDDPAMLRGDRELLTQLLVNLVENAINHCPAGTVISLGLARHGSEILATISDDGPGIPAAERDKVFRRLYRLDKSRTTPGNGLGLSLVRAISDLHGAEIRLEDNAPGLRVSMTFPSATTS